MNCAAEFSLLDPHQCSSEATSEVVTIPQLPNAREIPVYQNNGPSATETINKRKDSPMTVDESLERRAKPESEDAHVDSSSECGCIQFDRLSAEFRNNISTQVKNPRRRVNTLSDYDARVSPEETEA